MPAKLGAKARLGHCRNGQPTEEGYLTTPEELSHLTVKFSPATLLMELVAVSGSKFAIFRKPPSAGCRHARIRRLFTRDAVHARRHCLQRIRQGEENGGMMA